MFARSRNVQITGVGGLIHSCNIVNPYQTWNQTCSVCVKVSKHTFWSAFGALHCAIYGNVFNISRETSFGNLGDNTCDVGGTRNNGRGGGDYLGDEPDSKMLRRYLRMNMAHPATGFGATEDILDGNNSDLERPSFQK